MWPAALPRDCLTSTLSLEHSPTWKFSAELSLSPILRFLINRNFPPVLNMQWTSLYCLSMCIIWHLAIPPVYLSLTGREQGLCLQFIHCPASAIGRNPLAMGKRHTLQMLNLLGLLYFLWIKHCSYQCLCVESSLATLNL